MANTKKPKDPKSIGSTKASTKIINIAKEEPQPKWRPIDWNKVTTMKDMKVILSNMGLGCSEDAPAFVELEKYLRND